MAITLNTQQKLNTYLLERYQGQLFDTYYRAIEEYINGPIYRTLNIALNDLFISSATPHGLDSWELFYTTKPGEMPYIKWAELLILLNKTTREGPTFSNIRALLRFFDPTADISLVGSLAVLVENSEFTIGTPVPPFDQRTEYVELEEDSEFMLNSNDPPEFIVYDRDSILYETTILNVSSDNYRELLKTLLRQVLPANVRVNVRFMDRIEVYTYGMIASDVSTRKNVYRGRDLIDWTYAVTGGKEVVRICPFYGAETGVLAVTSEAGGTPPFRYFKIVGTFVTELVPEDNALINQAPSTLYPFGPDHIVISSAWPNKLTKIKVNNITTSVIQNQIQRTDWFYSRPTLHEQYIMDYTSVGPNKTIRVYDKDLNLVSTRGYYLNQYPSRVFPITKDKAFMIMGYPSQAQFCDFTLLPASPIVATQSLGMGAVLGTNWNWNGLCVADSRSLILATYDYTVYPAVWRYYNWNPYTNLYTLVYSSSSQTFGVLRSAAVVDTTLLLFFSSGAIIKVTNYSTAPTASTYYTPLGAVTAYESTVVRSSDQNII
mgnify:FL=1